jgi:hypothetical protein
LWVFFICFYIIVKGALAMALSAAERQAAFRKRMRSKGFRHKQVWIDYSGFISNASGTAGADKPCISLFDLLDYIDTFVKGMSDYEAQRLYAELAAYGKGLRGVWEVGRLQPDLFDSPEEPAVGVAIPEEDF